MKSLATGAHELVAEIEKSSKDALDNGADKIEAEKKTPKPKDKKFWREKPFFKKHNGMA